MGRFERSQEEVFQGSSTDNQRDTPARPFADFLEASYFTQAKKPLYQGTNNVALCTA